MGQKPENTHGGINIWSEEGHFLYCNEKKNMGAGRCRFISYRGGKKIFSLWFLLLWGKRQSTFENNWVQMCTQTEWIKETVLQILLTLIIVTMWLWELGFCQHARGPLNIPTSKQTNKKSSQSLPETTIWGSNWLNRILRNFWELIEICCILSQSIQ